MIIYWYEVKKLLSSAAIWGFIAACLLFNLFLVIVDTGNPYANFVGTVSKDTGYVLNQSFDEKLAQFTAGDAQAAYLAQLTYDTEGVSDVFDGYTTKEIGERYIAAAGITGGFAEAMRDKYAALQQVVDEKAAKDESLTLYFAGATYSQHHRLFNDLMGNLMMEGILTAVLLALLAVGYENNHKTEDIVCSTRIGRRILRPKMAASVSVGLVAYALLALLTFLVYFGINDYGGIWSSNVSSLFNYRNDLITGVRPFVTWNSFSVLTYFLAMLGVSTGLLLCFSLLAFGIGVLMRNHYIGFLVFLAANALLVALPLQIPQTLAAREFVGFYSMLSPVWLWLKHGIWFTDGDIDIPWPHFETIGLCVSLVTLAAFAMLSALYFRKRDLK